MSGSPGWRRRNTVLAARVAGLAGTLSALRGDAAERFSGTSAELTALAMPTPGSPWPSARWMCPALRR